MADGAARRAGAMIIAIDGPAAAGKGTLAERLAAPYRPSLSRHRPPLPRRRQGDGRARARPRRCRRGRPRRARRSTRRSSPTRRSAAARPASSPRGSPSIAEVRARAPRSSSAISPAGPGGAVLDGRDIGTAVCPDADVKIYVTATPGGARAAADRRAPRQGPRRSTIERILAEIRERDARDSGRAAAPLARWPPMRTCSTPRDMDIEAAFRAAVAIVERARAGRE